MSSSCAPEPHVGRAADEASGSVAEDFESDKEEAPLDATMLEACPMHLVKLKDLRPTQMAVGMQQVREKEAKVRDKNLLDRPKKLDKFLRKVWHRIPAIKGPLPLAAAAERPASELGGSAPSPSGSGAGSCFYVIDHHHLGLALMRAGVKEAYVAEVEDLSSLSPGQFWERMQQNNRVWGFDDKGKALGLPEFLDQLPTSLLELKDDPYRSLAALVRKAGGYSKSRVPYSEFVWANFLRPRVPVHGPSTSPTAPGHTALLLQAHPPHTSTAPTAPALLLQAALPSTSSAPEDPDSALLQVHLPTALSLALSISQEEATRHKLPGK